MNTEKTSTKRVQVIDWPHAEGCIGSAKWIVETSDFGHFPICKVSDFDAALYRAAPQLVEALVYARGIIAAQLGENSAHLVPLDTAIAKAKATKA